MTSPTDALRAEIREQPAVIERLLRDGREGIERVAAAVREAGVDHVVVAARGSSDHAAIYAQYALGVRCRLSVGLATPSILSLYRVAPRFERALVMGISQSGASPDIVGFLEAARAQGALTLALTNDPASALGDVAAHVIDLRAGAETAVAATKTYTAELAAVAMLAAALGDDGGAWQELSGIPGAIAEALATEAETRAIAADQAGLDRAAVIGRGFDYATAREWALKLKEMAYVLADPYSAADFEHGPIALLQPGFPVFLIAPSGPALPGLSVLVDRLREESGGSLLVVSDRAELRAAGRWSLPLPEVAPWLDPIVAIVPVQLHAMYLALARGYEPGTPRGLRKVTRTT